MGELRVGKEKLHLNLARIKSHGHTFEVVINPEEALKFRENSSSVDLNEVIRGNEIFSDAGKGIFAPENDLKTVFETDNKDEIIERIIREGDIQITSEIRNKFREEKKKRILYSINKNAIDPRTNLPIPIARLENAFETAKIQIEEKKSAEDQMQEILKKLKPVLPIKFELKKIRAVVPAAIAAKVYSKLKSEFDLEDEQWANDGSLHVVLKVASASEADLYDKLNSLSHGSIDTEVIEVFTK